MALYETLKNAIYNKGYTLLEAETLLNSYFRQLQITADQYNELMELKDQFLTPNSAEDEENIARVQLEKRVEALEARLDAIEKAVTEGGTEIETPEEPDGTKDNPILAYAGMTYYKDKYYKDPADGKTYICTREDRNAQDEVQPIYYTPSQLVGHYFALVEESEETEANTMND